MPKDIDLGVIQDRAKVLAAQDREMRKALVALRREAGLTQKDVAEFMGCTQQAVQKLERYDADPQLSTLRRYANAVGALVTHTVAPDNGKSAWLAQHGRIGVSRTRVITVPMQKQPTKTVTPTYGAASKVLDLVLAA